MSATQGEVTGTGRRAGLGRDDVVECALGIVEQRGASALTMRGLADELGVTTTTIYWHVGGRDEVIGALIERLSERQAAIEIVGDTSRDRVMSVAQHVWTSALTHRNVTALAHQVGATSLLELPLERTLSRELDAAGVRGDEGRDALRAILMCIAGFLVVAFRTDRLDGPHPETQPHTLWAEVVDPAIDPGTIVALQKPPDLPALFDTTLRAVVEAFVPDNPDQEKPVQSSPPRRKR